MAFATLSVDFVAKIASFEESMDRAKKSVDSLENRFVTMGRTVSGALAGLGVGLGVGAIAALAKSGIDAADSLNDMSQRLGVSVKDLASFRLAADQSGTSLDSVGAGIARLSRSIGEAEGGNKQLAQALQSLGITARDPKEALFQLADAVQKIEDPSKRAALLSQVLGKSYGELVPLLTQGSGALRESAKQSETFAEAMSRLAPDADKFNDSLSTLKINAAGAAGELLTKLVPGLAVTASRVTELLSEDHGVLALVRALSGLGKIPFDILIGDPFKTADTAAKRIRELNIEIGELERKKASGNGPLLQKLFGTPEEIDRQILVLKNQIAALQKFGDQIYKPKPTATAAKLSAPIDLSVTSVKSATPKVQGPIDVFDNQSFVTRDKGTADFIRKQYEAVNELQGLMAGDAKNSADDYAARLGSLISDTPIEKTRVLQENVALLDKAFFDGKISVDLHDQAIQNLTEHAQFGMEKLKTFTERMNDEFKSTFENAANGARKFSDVLDNIIRQMGSFFAKEAGSYFATSITSSLFKASADGNVFTNAPALSAYSGSVVSKPTLFPFANGIGLMGEAGAEAILPLKRGRNGKLGVSLDGGGGAVVVHNVYNIDARGADAGTEQRLRRLMKEVEDRAVDRSVGQVQNLNQRGQLRLS